MQVSPLTQRQESAQLDIPAHSDEDSLGYLTDPDLSNQLQTEAVPDSTLTPDPDADLPIALRRGRRHPRRPIDQLPSEPTPLPQPQRPDFNDNQPATHDRRKRRRMNPALESLADLVPESSIIETDPNEMGLFRQYRTLPSRDPDSEISIHHVADAPTFIRTESASETGRNPLAGFGPGASASSHSAASESNQSYFYPFPNASVFRLMTWFHTSGSKTLADLDRLVYMVLTAPDFKISDLCSFSADRESRRLDTFLTSDSETESARRKWEGADLPFSTTDIWHESTVKIPLPLTGVSHNTEGDAPILGVKFRHRNLLEVIKSGIEDHASSRFHWKGYKEFWKPSENESTERVYGEAYTSDAFHELEDEITPPDGCTLETAIAPIFIYSDATQLANFGTTSLWPIYLWFGNLSKYIRSKTNSFLAHHLAYLPSIPDLVQDTYQTLFGQPASDGILTFLRRELVQAVWRHLLNDEFRRVYKEGIVIKCGDGIWRRIFPRFFVYSADYPEKTLLASILQKGTWFCPTCLVQLKQIERLGTKLHDKIWSFKFRFDTARVQDKISTARKWIFERGYAAAGEKVKDFLSQSLIAVRNAFSEVILPYGRNYFELFARDLMHEYELGVWRTVVNHLFRMLYTYGTESIVILNQRFRQVPSFGRSTIRRFRNDVSAMKKLAARDFEDILQCAGPCFEGLFLQTSRLVERKIQDLLFIMAWWHASAKLRLHTDSSLHNFRSITDLLTKAIRDFANSVCPQFNTKETPKEANASSRRKAAAEKKKDGNAKPKAKATKKESKKPQDAPTGPAEKQFKLNAPKMHFLVHYPDAIARFGTTDSYSTQIGEQEHRRVKRFYSRTNKKNVEKQISLQERRQSRLRAMQKLADEHDDDLRAFQQEDLPLSDPAEHYHVSKKKHRPLTIGQWTSKHGNDNAFKNFIPKLHEYILTSLLSPNEPITNQHRHQLIILNDTIYLHNSLRINYTTYDNRREQDLINPRTNSGIMMLAEPDEVDAHPF